MQTPLIAAEQGGLFSRAQAADDGWSKGALDRALASGRTVALSPGIHVDAQVLADLSRRDAHLMTARAEILCLGDSWYAARRTAAVLHGLPLLGQAPAVPQLTRARRGPSVRSSSRHRQINGLEPWETTVLDGIPVTTLARTVFDLARRESFRSGVVVADAALRAGLDREELRAVLDAHRGWPGTRRARKVIDFADGRSESPLESQCRVTCSEEGLPVFEPQVQVWLDGELVARVDGLWRERLVVFEGDGAVKFVDDPDDALPALLVRQERLREAGLPVVRAFWRDQRRREQWARGVRRELEDNPGRLRPGVELRSTEVRVTPLDRSDHYAWPPLPLVYATPRSPAAERAIRRGAA